MGLQRLPSSLKLSFYRPCSSSEELLQGFTSFLEQSLRPMTPKTRTFLERSLSSVILLALTGGAVAWGEPIGYALLICIFCNITSTEWFLMLKERKERSSRILGLLAGLIYPWCIAATALLTEAGESHKASYALSIGYLVIFILIAFFIELYKIDYKKRTGIQALSSMGTTTLSFVYPVWLFSFALVVLSTPDLIPFLLWLVLTTKMCDIWAYVSGVLIGGKVFKRPFSPVVSPKKTWEGILGSFIITSAVSALLFSWMCDSAPVPFSNPYLFFLVLMPVIFVLSVVGDLAGSLVKRGLEVKDSGSLLPGIGGLFDLIDSPAFTVSAFVVFLIGSSL